MDPENTSRYQRNRRDKPLVLIVDDEPKNLQVLGSLLRGEDLGSAFAVDGQKALQIARKLKPDLILLDVMLPGLDGYEVCEALKSEEELAGIPVIFLTARVQTEDVIRGLEAGGVDYVTKPFNSSELLARVRTHLELKRAREELRAINRNQTKFFSIVAHDLRNPLSGLRDLPGILLDEELDMSMDDVREIALLMQQEAQRVYSLLEELLALGMLQMDRVQMTAENFELSGAVEEVCEGAMRQAGSKDIALEQDLADDCQVRADRKMICTVIRNLVQNAIKFSERGTTISIRSRPEPEERRVRVEVRDQGVGIEPESIEQLFSVNSKTTTIGTEKETGTGLGLPLCHELIKRHEGVLNVQSEPGRGSTFSFTLPTPESGFDPDQAETNGENHF
jgi:signal transduction histidine kinase